MGRKTHWHIKGYRKLLICKPKGSGFKSYVRHLCIDLYFMCISEHGGSEFLEFCSVIADKVALKGFQGYRAQLDNKSN